MTSSNVSGMAASIRNSVDSETFDLAGQTVASIGHIIQAAFAEPFGLDHMIRITLVTGAGKLGRQKYDDNAAKAVTTTLREMDFQEDRAASCVMDCAGTFKLQHDTGKNLKTVVVFPKVHSSSTSSSSSSSAAATAVGTRPTQNNNHHDTVSDMASMNLNDHGQNGTQSILFPGLSVEQWNALTTPSSKTIFEKMITSKCPAWIQKRQCLQYLEQMNTMMQEMDQKLCKGVALTDSEQTFYDCVSLPTLEERQTIVKNQMHHLVEQGQITMEEKKILMKQVTERIEQLSQQEITTTQSTKGKLPPTARIEKLQTMKIKATERKALIEKIAPVPPHGLRHEVEIRKLRKELIPLNELEAATKGRLLSIKETQTLAKKDEILQEISQLENSSRGWFEEDSFFAARVQASRSAWTVATRQQRQQAKNKPSTGATSVTTRPSTVNPWNTNTKPIARSSKQTAAAAVSKGVKSAATIGGAPKATNRGGSVFAAMMMDSDSE